MGYESYPWVFDRKEGSAKIEKFESTEVDHPWTALSCVASARKLVGIYCGVWILRMRRCSLFDTQVYPSVLAQEKKRAAGQAICVSISPSTHASWVSLFSTRKNDEERRPVGARDPGRPRRLRRGCHVVGRQRARHSVHAHGTFLWFEEN